MGLNLSPFTYDQLHQTIEKCIVERSSSRIFNVNVHAINLCFQQPHFYKILKEAEYVFCDGEGVRQALKYRGVQIPYRITYADWMKHFLPWMASKGFSVAFLGSSLETLEQATANVRSRYPDLRLTGFVDGYLDEEEQVKRLAKLDADVLIVGMGMPLQEFWITRNQHRLPFSVYLSGGAVFDYLSGRISRAPQLMRNYGLEWLYRLILEPRRLFSRYVVGNPLFVFRVLFAKNPSDIGV